MSVLDLDFYKLTMLQFIWKHYDDVPVTFRLHSRKQDLADVVYNVDLLRRLGAYRDKNLTDSELDYLRSLGIFEDAFLNDLSWLFYNDLVLPRVGSDTVEITGSWFSVSLWETVVLSAVSEDYSFSHLPEPDFIKRFADIYAIGQSGAKWADFGTRRRYSRANHESLVDDLAYFPPDERHGFIGTSNVDFAHRFGVKPVGTYAHELEMVLRTVYENEFLTTRTVLEKWGRMYPRHLRIALTDTYGTPSFLKLHGEFLLENDWWGVRLDSGNPKHVGWKITDYLENHNAEWDVVFSDGLDAETIVELQHEFGSELYNVNPVFGWGTGLTNPNSDLSLVMKATEANGQQTYKITDDEEKSIR